VFKVALGSIYYDFIYLIQKYGRQSVIQTTHIRSYTLTRIHIYVYI